MTELSLTTSRWLIILPEIYMLISLLVMLLYGLFHKTKNDIKEHTKFLNKYFSIGIMLCILALLLICSISYISMDAFNGLFRVDTSVFLFKVVLFISVILILLASKEYLISDNIYDYEYIVVLLFSVVGLSFLLSANDFIIVFLSMEFATLPFYLLSINKKYSVIKNQAILKYFILSLVSTGMFLYGVSFVYGFTGSLSFDSVRDFINTHDHNNLILYFAFLMIVISLAFKLSLAPFHMWVIDVYSGLNYSLTLFLNTVFKLCFVFVLLKMLWGPFFILMDSLWYIIYILAIISIAVGYIGAIYQRNIVKIIAYSGIVQMGFVCVSLLIKTENSMESLIIFLIIYIISNIGIFSVLMQLNNYGYKIITIDDLKGLYKNHPFYSFALSILFLSIAGIPPLGGFIGKLLIINLAITSNYYFLAFFSIIMSLIGIFYYIRIIKCIYTKNIDISEKRYDKRITSLNLVLILCLVFILGFILILKPLGIIISKVTIF